jgi:hypothetical protein
VSVAEIAARQRLEDQRTGGEPQGIREKPKPGGSGHPKLPGAPQPSIRATGQTVASPKSGFTAGTSFLGAQKSGNVIPPDSMGSVSHDQVVVSVNGRIKVFDKQGNLGGLNVTDLTFWNSVRNGLDVTDPGVEYDRLANRWIVSAINFDADNPSMTNNRVMIAVSSGPTITNASSFTFFFFNQGDPPPAGDSNLFADYPQMAVDANAVYVGVNQFTSTGSFSKTSAFVIRKSSVLGAGPIVATAFRGLAVGSGSGPFSPQPAQDMDPSVGQGYIVGVDNQVFSRLDVRRISDPGGTPSISGNLTIDVPATSLPLDVPAQGTSTLLDALDDRLFEAMIARDPSGTLSLWTAHNIRVNSSGLGGFGGTFNRTASRWYQLGSLSSTPSLTQSGTLFDSAASNPRFFWIPSIAANGQGHASLNSSAAGTGRFAEVVSSGRLASDPLGTTESFDITQTSSSAYNLVSTNPQRWGDYSQTVVDPDDNMTFWTFQEFANATNSWGVRVIQLKAPPPATPSSASPPAVQPGQSSVSVQVTATSSGGSGFFDPGPDTGGPTFADHISASVSGGVTVNSVTFTDPTHLTLNLNTTVAPNGLKNVTITNPDGQARTGLNVINVNTDVMIPPAAASPPETTITKGPKKKTHKRRPSFRFTSSQPSSTFQCQLDKGRFRPCTSPFKPPKQLKPGKHVFRAQAMGAGSGPDPSPAMKKFTVLP